MEPNQGIKAWQWIVTAIVIIVLIILGYYLLRGGDKATPENETTTTEENTTVNGVNNVMVSDQYPGNVVHITSAQLANPGWIVIHEDNSGTPGAIVGSAYFDKGTHPGKVTLSKNTSEGKIYYAMIHSDDGDMKFDDKKDLPLKNSRGDIIMKTFRVTSTITEIKG